MGGVGQGALVHGLGIMLTGPDKKGKRDNFGIISHISPLEHIL